MAKIQGRITVSAALKKAYYKKLQALVDDMNASVNWWLGAEYKSAMEPLIGGLSQASLRREELISGAKKIIPYMASDSASGDISKELKGLLKQWSGKYDDMSKDIADWFVKSAARHSNRNLQGLLTKAGYTVKINLTRHQRDKLKALTLENVNLIRSIPQEYFTQLTTITMQGIARGRDLAYLKSEIQKRYGIASHRAALIARDQNNKATSIITHMKYEELEITEAVWKHNSGAKEPRASHLAAHNKVYKIAEGLFFENVGRHIFPGEDINCGCTSVPIIPELRERIMNKENKR